MFNFSFRNKDNEFFELFAKSADLFHEGALVLHDGAEDNAKLKQKMEKLHGLFVKAKNQSDTVNRDSIKAISSGTSTAKFSWLLMAVVME